MHSSSVDWSSAATMAQRCVVSLFVCFEVFFGLFILRLKTTTATQQAAKFWCLSASLSLFLARTLFAAYRELFNVFIYSVIQRDPAR